MAYYDGYVTLLDRINLVVFRPDNANRTSRIRYVYLALFDLDELDYPQLVGQCWLGSKGGSAPTGFSDSSISTYTPMWSSQIEPPIPYSYYAWSPISLVWFKPTPLSVGQSLYWYVEDTQ